MIDNKVEVGQVVSVEPNANILKKDGSTYLGLKLVYQVGQFAKTKAIHNNFLAQNAELVETIQALEPGATVQVTTAGPPYYSLLDVMEVAKGTPNPAQPKKAYTPSSGVGKSTYVDNSIGMQVGNALTNAATLIAGGTKGTLEEVAVSVLQLGESLKARLTAGEFRAPKPTPQVAAPRPVPKAALKPAPKKVEVAEEENIFEED